MASANNNASRFKVVLLGEGRVGKTSLLLRYVKDTFDDRQISTIQVRAAPRQRYFLGFFVEGRNELFMLQTLF